MKILIVEDEEPIANYIGEMTKSILAEQDLELFFAETISEAQKIIEAKAIDLCLLDLNLYGQDGFSLLKKTGKISFETIIISAYKDKAIDAFENNVIDFVPKPFSKDRLEKALQKYLKKVENRAFYKDSLFSTFSGERKRLRIDDIHYIEASHIYAKVHFESNFELLDLSLSALENKLPKRFFRSHRSYIIDLKRIEQLSHIGGGSYVAHLKSHIQVPVSRSKYKRLKEILDQN
ncbi:MAG: LytTR family DNA-binding domain-containing protein [Anaerolineae bacterium]|nr:LytTR family DNA-binding domain-containing protein [Anaerolineae bacterium]